MERVEVRRSPRARRWRLEVPWGQPVRLTVPAATTAEEIERVLVGHRAWIAERRRGQVPRLGLDPSSVSESEARLGAREVIAALVDVGAEEVGVSYARIRVGSQRTLWGSCSPTGTLSFNWRLVLAPSAVLDYVVVHELCHLRVADHSPRFWSLVERHRPDWRLHRRWLREYGPELLAFTPGA